MTDLTSRSFDVTVHFGRMGYSVHACCKLGYLIECHFVLLHEKLLKEVISCVRINGWVDLGFELGKLLVLRQGPRSF